MKLLEIFRKYRFLLSKLSPYKWSLVGIVGILFAEIWLTVMIPIPLKRLMNDVFPKAATDSLDLKVFYIHFGHQLVSEALLILALLTAGVGVVILTASWIEQFWLTEIIYRVQRDLRRELFSKLFTRKQTYLDSKRKVDVVGHLSGDISNLEVFLGQGFPAIVRDVPMIAVLITQMFLINSKLTLVFCAVLLLYYVVINFFTTRNRVAARILRRSIISYEEDGYEALSSMAIAKSLRGERKLFQGVSNRISDVIRNERVQRTYYICLDNSVGMLNFIVKGIMYFVGGWAIFRGEVKIGDLFQMFAYMQTIEKYINSINKFMVKYPKASASADRLINLAQEIDLHPEDSGPHTLDTGQLRAANSVMQLKNVDFHHDETKPLLRDFSLSFPRGQLIAIAGTSGAGKSSFSRLLNRLNEPKAGEIFLGGTDVRELTLDSLRSTVRVVPQDTFIVSGTVRENLLIACDLKLDDTDLWRALESVQGEDFIKALPQGLDTKIGEGGHQLSGGQAKKLHVARAFLDRDSEILLVDEPTSGLDGQSAEVVLGSVRKLAENKSLVLWVTHQAHEIVRADAVLFFSADRNPVLSTHAELYATNAAYRTLLQSSESSGSTEKSEKREWAKV